MKAGERARRADMVPLAPKRKRSRENSLVYVPRARKTGSGTDSLLSHHQLSGARR